MMTMEEEIVKIQQINSGIALLTLNRPKALNALNAETMEKLQRFFLKAKEDPAIRGIILTGTGKAFCAGADINQLAQLDGQKGLAFARQGQHIFRLLEQLGKPSIAAINGFAFGGGLELAMAASLRIASTNASFAQPEIKLGVIPGFGGTQRLARLVGKGRALYLCLTGKVIKAEEAALWGLVSEVVSPEDLMARAESILVDLLKWGPIALKSVMTVIDKGYDLSLEDAFELEAAHFGLCCATADKNEGTSAFIEKRAAEFKGR